MPQLNSVKGNETVASKKHKLQEIAMPLLEALYVDENLSPTSAMLAALNRRVPSLEGILQTLDQHKDLNLVTKFVAENGDIIAEARNLALKDELKSDDKKTVIVKQTRAVSKGDIAFIKKYSIEQIEECLSIAIKQLTGESFNFSINNLRFEPETFLNGITQEKEASFDVRLKGRTAFEEYDVELPEGWENDPIPF